MISHAFLAVDRFNQDKKNDNVTTRKKLQLMIVTLVSMGLEILKIIERVLGYSVID